MNVEQELGLLDKKLKKLKVDYEHYFLKQTKRPPSELHEEVSGTIRKYSTTPIRNTALRFKYNAILATFNSYKEFWNKRMVEMEGGGPLREETKLSFRGGDKVAFDENSLKTVYLQYKKANEECKEAEKNITYDRLKKSLESAVRKIDKEKGVSSVDFEVVVKDKKPTIRLIVK